MMRYALFFIACLAFNSIAAADFNRPASATAGISPDGDVIVRLRDGNLFRYELDHEKDIYRLAKRFELNRQEPQFIYVSDSGDVVTLYLNHGGAIDLYGIDGELLKSWTLDDFMSPEQIDSCARTAATIQWFDEAVFYDREFVLRGPSRRVRQVPSSYTLMHSGNFDSIFAFAIACESADLIEIEMAMDLDQVAEQIGEPNVKFNGNEHGKPATNASYRSYDGQPLPSECANEP